MPRLIVEVSKEDMSDIRWEWEHNSISLISWTKYWQIQDVKLVTRESVDAATDKIMDIVTEGGYGETQLARLRPEVRKAIRDLLFASEEDEAEPDDAGVGRSWEDDWLN